MFIMLHFLGRFNLFANYQEFLNHRSGLRELPKYDEFSDLRFPIDLERVTKLHFT